MKLPEKQDFEDLLTFAGSDASQAKNPALLKLIANDTSWENYDGEDLNRDIDLLGFSALAAGVKMNHYTLFGRIARLWSKTAVDSDHSQNLHLEINSNNEHKALIMTSQNTNSLSVRCLKN